MGRSGVPARSRAARMLPASRASAAIERRELETVRQKDIERNPRLRPSVALGDAVLKLEHRRRRHDQQRSR